MIKNRKNSRNIPFGFQKLTVLDRLGIWLSKRAILKAVSSKNSFKIMELGSGYYARNLQALESRATQLVAVDFSLSDEVKRRPKYICVESGALDALNKMQHERFDLVLMISVLEHFSKPEEIVLRCYNILQPGGALIINVPTWFGKFFLETAAFRLGLSPSCEMDDHKMYYNKKDLWPILVKAGFLPSHIRQSYHKFNMNLFTIAIKEKKGEL